MRLQSQPSFQQNPITLRFGQNNETRSGNFQSDILQRIRKSRDAVKQTGKHRHTRLTPKQAFSKLFDKFSSLGLFALSLAFLIPSVSLFIRDANDKAVAARENQMRQYGKTVVEPLNRLAQMAREGRPINELQPQFNAVLQGMIANLESSRDPAEQALGQRLRLNQQLEQHNINQTGMELVRFLMQPRSAEELPDIRGFINQQSIFQSLPAQQKELMANQILTLYQSIPKENGVLQINAQHFQQLQTIMGQRTPATLRGVTPEDFAHVNTREDAQNLLNRIVDHPENFTNLSPSERNALKQQGNKMFEAIGFEFYNQTHPLLLILSVFAMIGGSVGMVLGGMMALSEGVDLIQRARRKGLMGYLREQREARPKRLNLTPAKDAEQLKHQKELALGKCQTLHQLRKLAAIDHREVNQMMDLIKESRDYSGEDYYSWEYPYPNSILRAYENRLHRIILAERDQKGSKEIPTLNELDFYKRLNELIETDQKSHFYLPEIDETLEPTFSQSTHDNRETTQPLEIDQLNHRAVKAHITSLNYLIGKSATAQEVERAASSVKQLQEAIKEGTPTLQQKADLEIAEQKHRASQTSHAAMKALAETAQALEKSLEKEYLALQVKWAEHLNEDQRHDMLKQLQLLQLELKQATDRSTQGPSAEERAKTFLLQAQEEKVLAPNTASGPQATQQKVTLTHSQ